MMFVEWFIWGAWFVPLWQYLNKLGFSPSEIAWSYSSTAIAAILSPVLVGVIADRYFAAQKVLGWLHLVGGALMLLFVFALLERDGALMLVAWACGAIFVVVFGFISENLVQMLAELVNGWFPR